MNTRRDFIKKAAFLSGAACFSGRFPASILRALAIDPEPGSTWMDAEHIVILMQENRSFDHCFGSLRGVRGFNDPRAITLGNGNPVWLQTNALGETYAPFRLNIEDTRATWMNCLPHGRKSQVDAWNNGAHNGWLEAKRSGIKEYAAMPLTLGYYTREDVPFNYALADAFTICDQHFCGAMTSTYPNRLLFWTGTIREKQNEQAKANLRNEDMTLGSLHWKTFPERLQQNGISWKLYQNEVTSFGGLTEEEIEWLGNFGCNPLEYFAQYNIRISPQYLSRLQSHIDALSIEIQALQKGTNGSLSPAEREKRINRAARKKKMLTELKIDQHTARNAFEQLPAAAKEIHRRAFTTNIADPAYRQLEMLDYLEGATRRQVNAPKSDVLYQFRNDVQSGNLPAISWLVAPQNFSDHPASPWYGAWFVSEVMDILTRNPDVWKKTIFILTYDENDGYFDHIPPFVATDPGKPQTGHSSEGIDTGVEFAHFAQEVREGVQPDDACEAPVGLGFRVPLIVASPWSRGGWVNSQVFDHTSVIQLLEKFASERSQQEIKESNISTWRRTICGDLTTVFRPFRKERGAALPFLKRDPFIEKIYNAKFKKIPGDYRSLSPAEIDGVKQNPQTTPLLPKQENGVRPSCALPYELYAEGALSTDRQSIILQLRAANAVFGDHAKGSPFSVYAYHHAQNETAKGAQANQAISLSSYAVAAGDNLQDSWRLDAFADQMYRLCIYGPNGFFREFRGDANDPQVAVSCLYEGAFLDPRKLTENIGVKAVFAALNKPYLLKITDNAYGASPIQRKIHGSGETTIRLNLKKNFGWYDFSLRIEGFPRFERRYAGRVETGRQGYSDPAMGRQQGQMTDL